MGTMVVGVRFRRASKLYDFSTNGLNDLRAGDEVIVETSRGREMGRVIIGPHEVDESQIVGELKPVERRATPLDRLQARRWERREGRALEKCRQKVAEHGLPMKVIAAEYNFDGTRLVFSFTAEKRVDFRALVRDLAKTFHARIELRQVGVRDEAKFFGGLGPCGRELCCRAWMTDFSPVSIKMAKHQGLPLSPTEISGVCGRLLCCLAFEEEHYVEARSKLPKVGTEVTTPSGRGKVVAVNALKETVSVLLESEAVVEVDAATLQQGSAPEEAAEADEAEPQGDDEA